ncbi:NADPH-dependent curcumin reductase [Zhongshania aliphaticivorans]|uniref:NADPH-dependent curcumin reductase n=1 Tax=Zhongshania aliphaticivorans TaxID=1470434 RepID=A0A5S9PEI5_9GAMM|nr:NADP-dependent oxidoreductase [Zhongshania aliphaticivorans]CAA0102323.1 NADPH-dependent curcumin reductase [Zhongshania aliphaticivorans]CAA0114393.1 NADPH-dependent curcumin reductase [Zhongshania aliphaticivorans]
MALPSESHAWVIDHYLDNKLDGSELRWQSRSLSALASGQVLIKTCLLSLDASNLLWLSEKEDYLPQLQIGDVMRGNVIARVEASMHPGFSEGDYILSLQSWADYMVVDGDSLLGDGITVKFTPHPEIPLDAYVGTLGITGWSAYIGMMEIGRLTADDCVLVSGAAGATGIMAAQIAKAAGAKVFGLAGGSDKCEFLTKVINLDGAIDYKASSDLQQTISELIPEGVDVFFDNVGGEILDAVLPNMVINGRIVASGSVSQYGKSNAYGIKNLPLVTTRRLRMEGFLILDYLHQITGVLSTMERWLLEGKLMNKNHILEGLERAPEALQTLMNGGNVGKLAIYLADH